MASRPLRIQLSVKEAPLLQVGPPRLLLSEGEFSVIPEDKELPPEEPEVPEEKPETSTKREELARETKALLDRKRELLDGKEAPEGEREKEPCPCLIKVIPFDCTKGTCQFPAETGTEPGGIRAFAKGPDPVHLYLELQLHNPEGGVSVQRIAPDRGWGQQRTLNLVNTPCVQENRCFLAFIVGPGGATAPTLPPPLAPYTDREIYRVTIKAVPPPATRASLLPTPTGRSTGSPSKVTTASQPIM